MTTTRTTLLTMAATLLAGTAGAQIIPGGALDVYDDNGARVGRYLGLSLDRHLVVLEHDGKPAVLYFSQSAQALPPTDGDWGIAGPYQAWYATTDCIGQPYVVPGSNYFFPRVNRFEGQHGD